MFLVSISHNVAHVTEAKTILGTQSINRDVPGLVRFARLFIILFISINNAEDLVVATVRSQL